MTSEGLSSARPLYLRLNEVAKIEQFGTGNGGTFKSQTETPAHIGRPELDYLTSATAKYLSLTHIKAWTGALPGRAGTQCLPVRVKTVDRQC